MGPRDLPGLPVARVAAAPLAELAQRDALRVVALGLVRLVVAPLALLASEGDTDAHVSAGHGWRAPSGRLRAKRRPASGQVGEMIVVDDARLPCADRGGRDAHLGARAPSLR